MDGLLKKNLTININTGYNSAFVGVIYGLPMLWAGPTTNYVY
jgi:hypothetical protein